MDVVNLRDSELCATALRQWANHIETGSVVLSAADVHAQRLQRRPGDSIVSNPKAYAGGEVKPLNNTQKQFVLRLRDLAAQKTGRQP